MNSTPERLVVKPSLLGYLFGARKSIVEATAEGIKFGHKAGHILVNYADLHQQIEQVRGALYDRIKVTTPRDACVIGWLESNIAEGVIQFSQRSLYVFYADDILASRNEIMSSLKRYYPRQKFWDETVRLCKNWQAIYRDVPPAGILSEAQHKAYLDIDRTARADSRMLEKLQQSYTTRQLTQHAGYFDTVESNPLTERQRLACVVDEANNLVLAGAGSGKTSVMIGRAGYLVKSKQANATDILMLAFAKKAADEMSERITEKLSTNCIKASTFHSLGQQIIATVENGKPSISVLATDEVAYNRFIKTSFNELLRQEDYKKRVASYFLFYEFEAIDPFTCETVAEYSQVVKDNDFRTAQGELVKGYQELIIANFLYMKRVRYQYEAKYEINTKTLEFRQYQPDFFLPDSGIYIEHYGIDRQGNTAPFIDKAKYQEGMRWKRELHQKNQTACIETFHYDWTEEALLERLEEQLLAHDVLLTPLSAGEILSGLKEKETKSAGKRNSKPSSRLEDLCQLLGDMLKKFKASNLDQSLFSVEEEKPNPATSALNLTQRLLDKLRTWVSKRSSKASNEKRLQSAEKLLMPLYEKYQQHLSENDDIDFDDMINKAIAYVQNGHFRPPWKFIMVDEFQDISGSRAMLVTALRDSVENCSLFCVGDDWQSIYRFTGSDLSYVSAFEAKFGTTKITSLDKTFRYNNSLSDIASRFVTKNPDQIVKDITTHKQVNMPAVSLLRADNTSDEARLTNLRQVLTTLSTLKPGADVLVLGRYRFNLPEKKPMKALGTELRLTLHAMTIHASKGKEADFVVVLGLEDGKFGFPSERQDHPLIDALLPKIQNFPFAEERRLFYVAITRAKERSYLIVDMKKPSRFVIEMIKDNYPIELNEFEVSGSQLVYQQTHCVSCEVGKMLPKTSRHGAFYGCSCFPRCKHLENGCQQCGAVMKRSGKYKICTNSACHGWVPLCPQCNGELMLRKGRYGSFWGCKNYRSNEGEVSCGYTVNNMAAPSEQSAAEAIQA